MTTTFNLTELRNYLNSGSMIKLSNELREITLDNKHDVSLIELLSHEGNEYFSFSNHATSLNESYWLSDEHLVTISDMNIATSEDAVSEDAVSEDAVSEDAVSEDAVSEDAVSDNLDISAIADLYVDFSGIELLELCQKLQTMAVKKIKSENKKTTKKDKPEKTQTEKKDRVSAKNFNYYDLLKSWHGVPTDKIIADGLNGGYSSSVINEDKRVINVLMGTDKDIVISQDWIDYIVNFWSENPDTTWVRLHYAFSKGGRKCSDRGLLCNYIIDNGVSKEDIEAAIASQN